MREGKGAIEAGVEDLFEREIVGLALRALAETCFPGIGGRLADFIERLVADLALKV